MKLRGLQDLLPFLNVLRREKISYQLDCIRDDAIMVTLTVVGARIEVDFFDDHIEFGVFEGDESVEDDPDLLFRIIRERWHDRAPSSTVA
ncbi:MAG TPA: hypothetical protein VHG30_14715 [Microvirga sp.]|nr:hypothetical protein [Microvirga sp.]